MLHRDNDCCKEFDFLKQVLPQKRVDDGVVLCLSPQLYLNLCEIHIRANGHSGDPISLSLSYNVGGGSSTEALKNICEIFEGKLAAKFAGFSTLNTIKIGSGDCLLSLHSSAVVEVFDMVKDIVSCRYSTTQQIKSDFKFIQRNLVDPNNHNNSFQNIAKEARLKTVVTTQEESVPVVRFFDESQKTYKLSLQSSASSSTKIEAAQIPLTCLLPFFAVSCGKVLISSMDGKPSVRKTVCHLAQPSINTRDVSMSRLVHNGDTPQTSGYSTYFFGESNFDVGNTDISIALYSQGVKMQPSKAFDFQSEQPDSDSVPFEGFKPIFQTSFSRDLESMQAGEVTLIDSHNLSRSTETEVMNLFALFFPNEIQAFWKFSKKSICPDAKRNDQRASLLFSVFLSMFNKKTNGLRNVNDIAGAYNWLIEDVCGLEHGVTFLTRPSSFEDAFLRICALIRALTPIRIAALDGGGRLTGVFFALTGINPFIGDGLSSFIGEDTHFCKKAFQFDRVLAHPLRIYCPPLEGITSNDFPVVAQKYLKELSRNIQVTSESQQKLNSLHRVCASVVKAINATRNKDGKHFVLPTFLKDISGLVPLAYPTVNYSYKDRTEAHTINRDIPFFKSLGEFIFKILFPRDKWDESSDKEYEDLAKAVAKQYRLLINGEGKAKTEQWAAFSGGSFDDVFFCLTHSAYLQDLLGLKHEHLKSSSARKAKKPGQEPTSWQVPISVGGMIHKAKQKIEEGLFDFSFLYVLFTSTWYDVASYDELGRVVVDTTMFRTLSSFISGSGTNDNSLDYVKSKHSQRNILFQPPRLDGVSLDTVNVMVSLSSFIFGILSVYVYFRGRSPIFFRLLF
jgi:hypothetical protein